MAGNLQNTANPIGKLWTIEQQRYAIFVQRLEADGITQDLLEELLAVVKKFP